MNHQIAEDLFRLYRMIPHYNLIILDIMAKYGYTVRDGRLVSL
jgi:hypothetical protein